MEPPGVFARLRRHWLLTGIGVMVAGLAAVSSIASIGPHAPFVKMKELSFASGFSQISIGTPSQLSINDNAIDGADGAIERGEALGDMLMSPELRGYIARAAGIPVSQLAVDGPVANNLQRTQQEPTGEKRSNELVTEGDLYRLTIDDDYASPELQVTAQAPTVAQAVALANGTTQGLSAYLNHIETVDRIPAADRLHVSQSRPALGSPAGRSGLAQVALITFIGVFVIWCGLELAATGVARYIRAARTGAEISGDVLRSSDSWTI